MDVRIWFPCGVKWCVAMTDHGLHCAVHRKFLQLHPEELDEEDVEQMLQILVVGGIAMTGSMFLHPKCAECYGTGECPRCDGEGTSTEECDRCGDEHQCECQECDGSGECETCSGSGKSKAIFQHPDEWRWHEEYRQWRKTVAA